MSARSRDLPRRSCLSTPGSNEKFLAKAPTVPADMTFLDLEDAVAPLEKEGARSKVVDAIKKHGGTVDYKIYENEGHGFARVENQIDAYKRVADFLQAHVPAADCSCSLTE